MALATKTDDLNLVPGPRRWGEHRLHELSLACTGGANAAHRKHKPNIVIYKVSFYTAKKTSNSIACKDSLQNGRNTLAKSARDRDDIYKKF